MIILNFQVAILLVASDDFGNKNGTVEDYVVELRQKNRKDQ